MNEPRADFIEAASIRNVSRVPLDKVAEPRGWAGRSIETAGWTSVLDPVRRQDFDRIDQADVTQRLGTCRCESTVQHRTQNEFGLSEQVAALKPADKGIGDRRSLCLEHEGVRRHKKRRLRGILGNGPNLPAVPVPESSFHLQRGEE